MSALGSGIRHVEVDPAEAVGYLAFMLGWAGGDLPVFVDGGVAPAFWLPSRGLGAELWRRAQALDERRSVQVEVGLPSGAGGATVLWAWCSSRDSTWRASRFQPAPSLVLRFGAGAKRLALWSLRELVPLHLVETHNERLSYVLRAPRTRCASHKLRIPLPGTFVRVGRSRPAPVMVTRMVLTDYTRTQVTSQLRDAPAKDAWRHRKTA